MYPFRASLPSRMPRKSARSPGSLADRYLVETDAPYLAPIPHRGQSNEPSFVRHTAEKLADIRGISLDQLGAESTANFGRLFSKTGVS